MDQMDDNLEVPNIGKSCTIANKDFQNSHLELDSTAQLQVEPPKIDTRTTGNLVAEGTERKKKTKNKDELQCLEQSDIMSSKNLSNVNNGLENEGMLNKNESTAQESDVEVTEHLSSSIVKKDHFSNDSCLYLEIASVACVRRKLLVLDVNGLLADIVMPAPKDCIADAYIWGRAVFKRPSCDDFLKFCFEKFDVGIWSSRSKKIIENFANYLLGDLQHKLLFCWDMSHTDPNLPWEKGYYNESNTLLLDDSPYKALLNPLHTAIFPHSFHYQDKSDNSLGPGGDLLVYLEDMLMCDDVRKYVEHHPFGQSAIDATNVFWRFYSRGIWKRWKHLDIADSSIKNDTVGHYFDILLLMILANIVRHDHWNPKKLFFNTRHTSHHPNDLHCCNYLPVNETPVEF
ncbi:unnamed protein product [Fraxinus pennsylvanica]|uniref:Mitochondrial import inner membrane translocase subunit TIM50 n=1 Tax=Fraxinus pennsylvanica TaxID=56036 RepID=A0AAD1YWL4_9LAMI|nr:unnamed protein product [Fraxinus pennsylvanica]